MEIENNTENQPVINVETTKVKSRFFKVTIILFLTIFLLVFGFFAFFSVQAPHKKAKEFQEKYAPRETNDDSESKKTLEILALENAIAFQRSDLSLSSSDSINLIVDLVDNKVFMELQGVNLFETKIVKSNVSNFLKKLDPQILNNYISKPFKVKKTVSTVEKGRIKINYAPKDEAEADSRKEETPTDSVEFTRYSLIFDRDLVLEVIQDSIVPEIYKKLNNEIVFNRIKNKSKEIFDSSLKLQPTSYTPTIQIVIDQRAARTIFRSIPTKANMALRLGFRKMPNVSNP